MAGVYIDIPTTSSCLKPAVGRNAAQVLGEQQAAEERLALTKDQVARALADAEAPLPPRDASDEDGSGPDAEPELAPASAS